MIDDRRSRPIRNNSAQISWQSHEILAARPWRSPRNATADAGSNRIMGTDLRIEGPQDRWPQQSVVKSLRKRVIWHIFESNGYMVIVMRWFPLIRLNNYDSLQGFRPERGDRICYFLALHEIYPLLETISRTADVNLPERKSNGISEH